MNLSALSGLSTAKYFVPCYTAVFGHMYMYTVNMDHLQLLTILTLFMLSKTIGIAFVFQVFVSHQSELIITSPLCPPTSQNFLCLFGCLLGIHNTSTWSSPSPSFPSLSHDLPSWFMSCIIGQATSDSR